MGKKHDTAAKKNDKIKSIKSFEKEVMDMPLFPLIKLIIM